MLEVVSYFIIFVLSYIFSCYVFCKINNEKFLISIKLFIFIILFSIINYYISVNYDSLMKCLTTNLLNYILFKLEYKKDIINTMMGVLFIYIGYLISELTFSILFIIIVDISLEEFIINPIGLLVSNCIIFGLYLLLFNIKKILYFIRYINFWFSKYKKTNILFKVILIEVSCFTFLYPIIFQKVFNNVIIFYISLIGIIVFIGGYFKEKSGNNKLSIEYGNLLEYAKTYEEEVVEKSKRQHEYKNQLIILDDMISKTNKKAKNYIKKILDSTEDKNDNNWLIKLKDLPSGGIKGLVHFKIKKMINNNISVYIEVDKKLSKKKKWFNNNKDLEDISKLLGVYLDNAIEASLSSKDKQIIIEFIDNGDNIEFKLSNSYNYDNKLDYKNLDSEGYSTKGVGRGYGLSLAKDIINKNNILSEKKELDGKFYVQKLYIKNRI